MSRSSSCLRCGTALAEETPGGLCATCVNPPVPVTPRLPTGLDDQTDSAFIDGQATNVLGPVAATVCAPLLLPRGYEFRGSLGQGGMGLVVRAYEVAGDREVALKLIRTKADDATRRRFCVEAQSLARLKHPNVVQVFSVEVNSITPYFTMELVDGPGLDAVLQAGPLPVAEAVRLIAGAARGIAAAHAAGVVHRDLKPSNILLAADGTPKVTDFGLAKRTDRDDQLTVADAILGTPSYMAPEQAGRRHGEIGPLSDVYSLGATLYALLSGEPPFHTLDPVLTAAMVLTAEPKPLRERRPEIPNPLAGIVHRAMAKAPADRYASAGEFADDLDRWQSGRPTRSRAPRRTTAAIRRLRLAALPAVAALLLGGGATFFAAAPRPADEPPAKPGALLTAADVKSALQLGKKVVLIDEGGIRVESEWAAGAGEVRRSKTNDVAFSFLTADYALLLLVPDPGVDAYRVRAELRQDEAVGDADPTNYGRSEVGIVVGYGQTPVNPNQTVHRFETVSFGEYTPPNVPPNLVVRQSTEYLRSVPFRTLDTHRRQGPVLPLAPNAPGVWRDRKAIEVDVRRSGLTVRHNGGVARSDFPEIERRRTEIDELLRRTAPNFEKVIDRGWSPQSGVGIYAFASWVSVSKLTIESIPSP